MWQCLPRTQKPEVAKTYSHYAKVDYEKGLKIANDNKLLPSSSARLSLILRYATLQWETTSRDTDPGRMLCEAINAVHLNTLNDHNLILSLPSFVQIENMRKALIEWGGGRNIPTPKRWSLIFPTASGSTLELAHVSHKALTPFILPFVVVLTFYPFRFLHLFLIFHAFIYLYNLSQNCRKIIRKFQCNIVHSNLPRSGFDNTHIKLVCSTSSEPMFV